MLVLLDSSFMVIWRPVQLEGTIKGILVTPCGQELASYEFIKGKPLSLLDSSDLLHLLKQPGHKASIDIAAPNVARLD
jgi:hypothetical protein